MSRKRQPPGADEALVRTFAVTPAPGPFAPPQSAAWHQLLFATRGALRVRVAEVTWAVSPGRALWLPAGTAHVLTLLGAVDLRTVYFAVDRFARPAPRACTVEVTELLRALILHVNERGALLRARAEDRRLAAVLRDQVRFVEEETLSIPWPTDPRAARLARLLARNPARAELLPDLGRKVGASARTLERLFRRETGMGFAAWRRQLRFVTAIAALARGEPVATTALDAGYASASAFIAAFKKELGTTPRRYLLRRRAAAGAAAPRSVSAGRSTSRP